MGGLDWAGLPIVVELLGVDDIDALLLRLSVIKHHRPTEASENHGTANTVD